MSELRRESPLSPDLVPLFARHAAEGSEGVPPESNHMLGPAELAVPSVAFYVLREAGVPVAMGAVKTIAPGHGEVKSMHVLAEARGRGLSRLLLQHLMTEARAAGLTWLSLETGTQPVFTPARGLYTALGFVECGPFGDYRPDPNSIFMTRLL